jgi:hypothetical protein
MTSFKLIIGWFPLPALILLAGVLIGRKLYREFPFFLAYVCAVCLDHVATLSALRDRSLYITVYWLAQLLVTVFSLLAVYELFVKRFFRAFSKVQAYRYIFACASMLIMILSVLTLRNDIDPSTLAKLIHVLDLARVAILVFFIALALFMGRRWARYEFGVALGFGLDAAVFLIVLAVFARHTPTGEAAMIFGYAPVVAYNFACVVWLVSFLRPRREEYSGLHGRIDPTVLAEAKQSEDALKTWLRGKTPSD